MFTDKYPFYMFIKSKLVKYGIKVWVATDAKNSCAYNMQVYTGKTDRVREKKQGLQVAKGIVCHTYGSGSGVNANNFFTSCELANLFLTRKMTLVGTLWENKSEIQELFLSGKQKEVSSIFGFTNDLTWVSQETRLSSSVHHSIMTAYAWMREKTANLKSSCTM
jgi:hypothetical protein